MVMPALLLTKWLAIPPLQAIVQSWPYLVQLIAAIFIAEEQAVAALELAKEVMSAEVITIAG